MNAARLIARAGAGMLALSMLGATAFAATSPAPTPAAAEPSAVTPAIASQAAVATAVAAAAAEAPAPARDDSVYQGLGAKAGIHELVASFIALVLADARIKDSFADSDMVHFAQRIEQQLCDLGGGPCRYQGKDMADIHDGLNVTSAQFVALTEDLQMAMERHGVASRIQFKLVALLAPMQRAIVTR
jgi:hemoglobin